MIRPKNQSENGFVLVNALIIVALLAGLAAFLLARAEMARARAFEAQNRAQIEQYLDAFEALAKTRLTRTPGQQSMDHLGQAWAQSDINVALDRGRVAGQIVDLQGRFNINWLANTDDAWAKEGFNRLLEQQGFAPGLAEAIADFVSPDGPETPAVFSAQSPAIAPVGGPVLMTKQLLALPELSAQEFDKLVLLIAALPSDKPLNVNTAQPEVMRALVPGLSIAQVDRLLLARRQEPYRSSTDFVEDIRALVAQDAILEADEGRFSVSSQWFAADISAQLERHERHRRAVFERRLLPDGVQVAYRLRDLSAIESNLR